MWKWSNHDALYKGLICVHRGQHWAVFQLDQTQFSGKENSTHYFPTLPSAHSYRYHEVGREESIYAKERHVMNLGFLQSGIFLSLFDITAAGCHFKRQLVPSHWWCFWRNYTRCHLTRREGLEGSREGFREDFLIYLFQIWPQFHPFIQLLNDILFLSLKINLVLFIYFWLCWVFVAARGLSLVATSGVCSVLRCVGFSLQWLLLLWSTGSRHVGFSSCRSRALERRLSSCGAWA